MPLNGYIASLMKKFQLKQMKLKDKRIKLMNEILGRVKVLNLYAWEPSFISQVTAIRNQEIKVMKKAAYFNAFMSFFWTTAPFMVGLGAFTAYIFADGGQVLTAEKAFVTLSYLNLMRIPLAAHDDRLLGPGQSLPGQSQQVYEQRGALRGRRHHRLF